MDDGSSSMMYHLFDDGGLEEARSNNQPVEYSKTANKPEKLSREGQARELFTKIGGIKSNMSFLPNKLRLKTLSNFKIIIYILFVQVR